ncbi:MAG TPA: hypothetical protein IAA59_00740 [Candidatus Faecaligallichristensenella faecipullorum]|nr:hypothetical protein [Candidatus Faecaligallichristensenella faecipullorum]
MIQETIEGRRVSSIQGFLLIIAIVAGMYLLSGLAGWLQAQLHFEQAGLLIWLYAGLMAVWLMRFRVMAYRYTYYEGRLMLERKFGDHAKILVNVPLCDVKALGPMAETLAKHPNAKPINRLYLKEKAAEKPVMALIYAQDGATRAALFQPSPALQALIRDHMGFPKEEA